MPKKIYHIKSFEGGLNKKDDPRDIEDNQFSEAFNVDLSNKGRIMMPGDCKSGYNRVNSLGFLTTPNDNIPHYTNAFSPGSGLFAFYHDFTFGSDPKERSTEFLCINDGATINIWSDSIQGSSTGQWLDGSSYKLKLKLGMVDYIPPNEGGDVLEGKFVEPVYYKAGNGLRVSDGNFLEQEVSGSTLASGITATATSMAVTANTGTQYANALPSIHLRQNPVYVKINSEIMKVTARSTDNITIQRGRLGTTAAAHDSGTQIYWINVPRILTHANRPMLEKAGTSTNINRWVYDAQYPEAPKAEDLRVFNFNTLAFVGESTLAANSVYPSEPEKVFLGFDFSVSDITQQLKLKSATAIQLESGNSTEQIVIVTVANANDVAVDITSSTHGFAIGKYLSISNAGNDDSDGTVLNGVHEIVGFGSADGEVKIAAEHVSYTQDGTEIVILEDEIIDDNLKNKYIFGMSYLYDGGGEELQESNITTGFTHSDVGTHLIPIANAQFQDSSQWFSGTSSFGSKTALSTTEANDWDYIGTEAHCDGTDNEFLWYESNDPSRVISTSTDYYVKLKYRSGATGTIKVYVGVGPDDTVDHTDAGVFTDGTNYKTINTANGGDDTTYSEAFIIRTIGTVDTDAIIAISVDGYANGSTYFKLDSVNVHKVDHSEMSSSLAVDFRMTPNVVKSSLAFLCNNSGTASAQNNSWNERIQGFRLYMKQVDLIDEGTVSEWLLLYDVNIQDGTYVMHAKDTDIETLTLGNISSNDWDATNTTDAKALVVSNIGGDTMKTIPLSTYESENGYIADTNLFARYKTAAVIDRKVFIGNLKISGRTFPDRMIRADADKFDTFPSDGTHYIDVAPSDGESIMHLQAIGRKLIQFKENTAYLINVTTEGEELEDTWPGAGIKKACQVAKASKGVFWANSQGLYYYDGKELTNVTSKKFGIGTWIVNESDTNPIVVGYDEPSNKIIILTSNVNEHQNGGYIYDITNDSMVQCENLFNWYPVINATDDIIGEQDEV